MKYANRETRSWFWSGIKTVLMIVVMWAIMAFLKTMLLEGGSWLWLLK